ncbi:alpha/beta fold hydrolase [Alsobacter sp. SYSU BS001988]
MTIFSNDHFAANRLMPEFVRRRPVLSALATAAAALAVAALVNNQASKRAEAANRPTGRFVEVNGIRLHYIERGTGEPLVLLHGNGSMIQDFVSSGLVDLASKSYRTIVFDRPGYGHSARSRDTLWTPAAQADLIHRALGKLGVTRAVVLGHSWGASVAVALGFRHPQLVKALVLASGYYYPSARVDVVALSGPAVPLVGDIVGHTIAPLMSRVMWPAATRKLFDPAPVPEKFEDGFPKEMTFRPSQIHASAEETAMMIPDAFAMRDHYGELKMPVAIIAGDGDRLIDLEDQSARLHGDIPQSTLDRVAGAGHMVHQSAPERVLAAIDKAA